MRKYQFDVNDPSNTVQCKIRAAKVSFKNTRETSRVLINKSLNDAEKYLKQVIKRVKCVPMRRYGGGVGRTSQANEFKHTKGRWPVKSCTFFLDLIKNLKANARNKNLDEEKIIIKNIVVNKAPVTPGRLFRAYGRINRFDGHPCHIQVVGILEKENVPKLTAEEKMEVIKN